MENKFGAIVVGAGPAGSTVAKIMALAGMKVLVVDRLPEIGHVKRCGEGLSRHHLDAAGIEPNPLWIRQPIDGAVVVSPNGTRIKLEGEKLDGYVIERKVFDKWLAQEAAAAGAKIQSRTDVKDIIREKGKICGVVAEFMGETVKYYADLIIAADGVDSLIARKAGINTTLKLVDICTCAEFEMAGIKLNEPDKIEICFGNDVAPGGYAWVFPKGQGRANVGLGVRGNRTDKTPYEYLKKFVKQLGYENGSVIEVNIGGVPVGGNTSQYVADNFALVGDAARQVNPIHGGGIGIAISSARILGEVAVEAWKKKDFSKDFLSSYEKKWDEAHGKKMRKLVRLRKFADNLSDRQLDDIAKKVKGFDLYELSQGKFRGFVRLAGKSPGLVRYLPLLLKS
jgi:digeranylgeranylglycerophospholipid reductase